MQPRRSHTSKVALAVAIVGALVAWYSQRNGAPDTGARPAPAPSPQAGSDTRPATGNARGGAHDFDFYLLALTIHPAFCADGHMQKSECRARGNRLLVIHGLWPERNQPGAYPHDCPAPRLALDAALERELEDFMPGVASGLHEHEWREHGACSGLEPGEYFRRTLDLARDVDAALGARLTTLAGRDTSAAELRETADAFHPGLGETLTFQCRNLRGAPAGQRARPYLVEIRQCVDDDGPGGAPATPVACAGLQRRDQGCGSSFRIAERR